MTAMVQQEEDYDIFLNYNTLYKGNGNRITLLEAQVLSCSKTFVPCNWDEGVDQMFGILSLFVRFIALSTCKFRISSVLHTLQGHPKSGKL